MFTAYINNLALFFFQYQTYKFKKEGRGNCYPFVFNDILGLEDGARRGVRAEELSAIILVLWLLGDNIRVGINI